MGQPVKHSSEHYAQICTAAAELLLELEPPSLPQPWGYYSIVWGGGNIFECENFCPWLEGIPTFSPLSQLHLF